MVLSGDGSVKTIKHVSYMNIRVSHEIKGAADELLPLVYEKGRLKNVLIISPPGCGKTTLLRDLIRQISDGNACAGGMCVGVVDERSEIAALIWAARKMMWAVVRMCWTPVPKRWE